MRVVRRMSVVMRVARRISGMLVVMAFSSHSRMFGEKIFDESVPA